MIDLTILYYTANLIPNQFAENVRTHLLETTLNKVPIISISQKPIDFGDNLCCTGLEPCIYNVYKQILVGAKYAKTKYVACCEDDSLYTPEHFEFRPAGGFAYNQNRWRVYPDKFLFKHRNDVTAAGMWNCIAMTDLMVKTLSDRFEKYPVKGSQVNWGEPGRYERHLGLPPVQAIKFSTKDPNVTFAHRGSLGGVRRVGPRDTVQPELPPWGKAEDLWKRMWNEQLV